MRGQSLSVGEDDVPAWATVDVVGIANATKLNAIAAEIEQRLEDDLLGFTCLLTF